MAINKNALIRYQALDKCFRNPGRKYFLQDLLEACNEALAEYNLHDEGIKRRQLFEDIKFMESDQGWSIPLERYRDGQRVYYRYSDLNFSINNQPLNETEANQIKSALTVLSRFKGTPQFEWVNEMIPEIESKLGFVDEAREVIDFESNIDLQGLNNLSPIYNAIVNQRVLEVDYQDFKSQNPYKILFHPYYLRQYNNRWFAFGLNQEKDKPDWNLALDRIISIVETNKEYIYHQIDWDEYFYDIVGVSKPDQREPEDIRLLFSPEQAPYITTKPIHPSQKHQYVGDELEVRIRVIPNFELERLIISYGERVKVLEPESLRRRIAERFEAARQRYF